MSQKENKSKPIELSEDKVKKAITNVSIGPDHMKSVIDYWNNDLSMAIYPIQEELLNRIFEKYPENNNKDVVAFKVKLVNNYYSTNLKEGYEDMVDNIIRIPNFTDRVLHSDYNIINDIRKVESHVAKNERKDCISFASKYCSRINPKAFPIYDNHVRRMLCFINKKYNFTSKFTLTQIDGNYPLYKEVINDFIEEFFQGSIDYKQFDQYIWTWAKRIINKGY